MQNNLKINFKKSSISIPAFACMSVFDKTRMINQINGEDAEYLYNSLVGNPEKSLEALRKENKELFIDVLRSQVRLNPVLDRVENRNEIIVKTEVGIFTYSKLKLAIFWLTHSNDIFFNTFGFNWVPDLGLQEVARSELNKKISVGIDFGVEMSKQVNNY